MNYLQNLFNHKNPTIPDSNEATRIINLALLIIAALSKANKLIKIDMVNPIPPKKPAPNNFFILKSLGNFANPISIARYENTIIPKGLPIIRPKIIPIE